MSSGCQISKLLSYACMLACTRETFVNVSSQKQRFVFLENKKLSRM